MKKHATRLRLSTYIILPLLSFQLLQGGGQCVGGDDRPAQRSMKPKLLISIDGLKRQLDAGNLGDWIIVDCRDAMSFEKEHVPGARRVDVSNWKSQALADNGRGLQDAQRWAKAGSRLGLTRTAQIVVYGDSVPSTARIWWLLRYIGCSHAMLLDGRFDAWQRRGFPTSTTATRYETTSFVPQLQPERLATIEHVKRAIGDERFALFDTRSDSEYLQGRIPRSIHLEWKQMLKPDGTFKPPPELRKLFKSVNFRQDQSAVTYCRSGGRASVEAFALELAGYKNVKNYFCSWQQYRRDSTAEVEK